MIAVVWLWVGGEGVESGCSRRLILLCSKVDVVCQEEENEESRYVHECGKALDFFSHHRVLDVANDTS